MGIIWNGYIFMLPTTSSWEIAWVWRERPTIRSVGPSILVPLTDYESTFFIRLFTFFKLFVSIFWSLGNFIRLLTLFVVSVFRSLGNFMRLVTLFIISLNCSQFMWESFGMATFSCFPLQVHGKLHEYGGKGLQLDQWAPPFWSHWPTTSPPFSSDYSHFSNYL